MIRYTVLVPQRNASESVTRLLPLLDHMLERLVLPYEIISIDDASSEPSRDPTDRLLDVYPHLRLLRFDRPRGMSAALSAGIAAARGDLIVGWDATSRVDLAYLPHLIARLSRHDLVIAERERSLTGDLRSGLANAWRIFNSRAELQPSETVCWAAKRQVLSGLALGRGAFRVLPALAARRGYRVCRLLLAEGLPPQGRDFRLSGLGRLTAGWVERRFEPHLALEVSRGGSPGVPFDLSRGDIARPEQMARPQFIEVEQDRRN